jgi:hypothetical protein
MRIGNGKLVVKIGNKKLVVRIGNGKLVVKNLSFYNISFLAINNFERILDVLRFSSLWAFS